MGSPTSEKRLIEPNPLPKPTYFTPYQPSFTSNSAAFNSAQASISLQNDTLNETTRVAAQSDILSASILDHLQRQHEQLEQTNATLDHADSNLDSSSKLITKMISRYSLVSLIFLLSFLSRITKNRRIMYVFLVAMITLCIFVLVLKLA